MSNVQVRRPLDLCKFEFAELTLCRRRRVKCDEAKPCCFRCQSSNRICEGYGIILDTPKYLTYQSCSKTHREHGDSLPILQPKPTVALKIIPFLNHSESVIFELFRSQTVVELAGFRSARFWRNIVLPACHSEPAIFHASMALANASCPRTSTFAREDIPRLDTLNHYNKAIHHLKAHVSICSETSSLRVALIACILFIALELSTGRFQEAGMHLNQGRTLLQSSTHFVTTTADREVKTKALVLVSNPKSVEDEIWSVFADLDLQSTYFGSYKPQLKLEAQKSTQYASPAQPFLALLLDLPRDFSDIQEANKYLIILTNKCLQFIGHKLMPESHSLQHTHATFCRQHLNSDLKNWNETYDRMCLRVTTIEKSRHAWKQQSTLMLIQSAWLSVLVPTSYFEIEETDYDSYIEEFTTITNLAASVLPERGGKKRQFSLEFGLAAPLSWTVIKCRDPYLRRRALSLIERAGHEGMWEPKLVSQLVKECILLEEGIEDLGDCCHGWGAVDDWRTWIPLQKRVITAVVVFEKSDYAMLQMRFRRKVWNSEGKFIGMEEIVRSRPYKGS